MNLFGLEQWNAKWESVELTYPVCGHPRLVRLLSGREPGQPLELACGEGKQAIWLATQGWQVTAMDFSDEGTEAVDTLFVARRGL